MAAINKNLYEVKVNQTVEGLDSQLRPDIVATNKKKKEVIIVDINMPFENGNTAFNEARNAKIAKYEQVAMHFRAQGFTARVFAWIVGPLGGFDRSNFAALKALSCNRRYTDLMCKLMVSDAIRYSRDIYVKHVSTNRTN